MYKARLETELKRFGEMEHGSFGLGECGIRRQHKVITANYFLSVSLTADLWPSPSAIFQRNPRYHLGLCPHHSLRWQWERRVPRWTRINSHRKSTWMIIMGDFNAKIGRGGEAEKSTLASMAFSSETTMWCNGGSGGRKQTVGSTPFPKESRKKMDLDCAECKKLITYLLISAYSIMKNVSVVNRLGQKATTTCCGQEYMCNNSCCSEKGTERIESVQESVKVRCYDRLKQPTGHDDGYLYFAQKFPRCTKTERIHLWPVELRVSEAKKEMFDRNVKYFFLCKLIKRRLKEDIEDHSQRRLVMMTQRRHGLRRRPAGEYCCYAILQWRH